MVLISRLLACRVQEQLRAPMPYNIIGQWTPRDRHNDVDTIKEDFAPARQKKSHAELAEVIRLSNEIIDGLEPRAKPRQRAAVPQQHALLRELYQSIEQSRANPYPDVSDAAGAAPRTPS